MLLAACSPELERSSDTPEAGPGSAAVVARIDSVALDRLTAPIAAEIERGAFPGAALAVGIGAGEYHLRGLGAIGWTANAAPVDPAATIYDLASVTKVVATASAILLLVDEGRLALDDPISLHLPGYGEGVRSEITIRHLLTHTSGLPEGAEFRGATREERIERIARFPIFPPVGGRAQYSDVGFVLLGEIIEGVAGEPLPEYLERKLFRPLGMASTSYLPGLECEACAPTGRLRDQSLYRGRPFDPVAQRFDGISGNAGLFSTAADLATFARMILNGGELDGVRVLSEEAVAAFVAVQPVAGRYRLAWEGICPEAEAGRDCSGSRLLRHTGWTGTSIHLDLDTGAWIVLLTNRTYEPRAQHRLPELRAELFEQVIALARDTTG